MRQSKTAELGLAYCATFVCTDGQIVNCATLIQDRELYNGPNEVDTSEVGNGPCTQFSASDRHVNVTAAGVVAAEGHDNRKVLT